MGLVHDIMTKIRPDYKPSEPIYIHAPAETLCCKRCGQYYFSRGKNDPGICRKCEQDLNAMLIGGPYDGEKAYEK